MARRTCLIGMVSVVASDPGVQTRGWDLGSAEVARIPTANGRCQILNQGS